MHEWTNERCISQEWNDEQTTVDKYYRECVLLLKRMCSLTLTKKCISEEWNDEHNDKVINKWWMNER